MQKRRQWVTAQGIAPIKTDTLLTGMQGTLSTDGPAEPESADFHTHDRSRKRAIKRIREIEALTLFFSMVSRGKVHHSLNRPLLDNKDLSWSGTD